MADTTRTTSWAITDDRAGQAWTITGPALQDGAPADITVQLADADADLLCDALYVAVYELDGRLTARQLAFLDELAKALDAAQPARGSGPAGAPN